MDRDRDVHEISPFNEKRHNQYWTCKDRHVGLTEFVSMTPACDAASRPGKPFAQSILRSCLASQATDRTLRPLSV